MPRPRALPLRCPRQAAGSGLVRLVAFGHRCRTRSSPAFHSQNLKLPAPFVADTVHRILEESVLLPSLSSGEVEVDVAEAEWYQRLSKEAIAIATFGRNYDEGSAVFQMLAEHASYATERPSRFFSSTAAARVPSLPPPSTPAAFWHRGSRSRRPGPRPPEAAARCAHRRSEAAAPAPAHSPTGAGAGSAPAGSLRVGALARARPTASSGVSCAREPDEEEKRVCYSPDAWIPRVRCTLSMPGQCAERVRTHLDLVDR
ncbi:unnamed protein product [Miscanthus lutarioriparius]|uniref:Uncharacterized protein n=1 Tax=Miscanthus lutarioriparius TaxID=422564 RepID=A0A811Q499_9POAL|nr:unnamed protein product [Miscanthus lutarioriparius]